MEMDDSSQDIYGIKTSKSSDITPLTPVYGRPTSLLNAVKTDGAADKRTPRRNSGSSCSVHDTSASSGEPYTMEVHNLEQPSSTEDIEASCLSGHCRSAASKWRSNPNISCKQITSLFYFHVLSEINSITTTTFNQYIGP